MIASRDGVHISDYYIGGQAENLNSILNVCLGLPTPKEMEFVKKMGFLDYLLN